MADAHSDAGDPDVPPDLDPPAPPGAGAAMTASGSAVTVPNPPPPSPSPAQPAKDESVMTLVDHLSELRSRLVRSIVAIAIGSAVGWIASPALMDFLRRPIGAHELQSLSPGELFFVQLKVAAAVGIILAMPVVLYQVWAFIAPGLTTQERGIVRPWIPIALALFTVGVVVAYVILPFAIGFLLSFERPGYPINLTANNYYGFITTLFLAFGLTMEFPVLLFGLSRVGIVTSARLRSVRRYVILGIAIFSTVVTPGGDIVSPTVLGLTMYGLFELAIVFIRRSGR
jgi:sec-independent protein translocase protein TatC